MESGRLSLAALAGPFDLQATLESGQSYLWWRADGADFTDEVAHGGDAWYETVVPPVPGVTDRHVALRVRQDGGVDDGTLEWQAGGVVFGGDEAALDPDDPAKATVASAEATAPTDGAEATPPIATAEATAPVDAEALLTHLLRLDDDLPAIYAATDDEPLVAAAYDRYRGLRLVRDPPFPCLVSFICSAQMRVARIHGMQVALRETYGVPVAFEGFDRPRHTFPSPAALAARSEQDLRDLSLGYRAPYVRRTAEMIATGEADPRDARGLPYEDARAALTEFVGVGDKVADCVLLFSLGYLQAIPLDTWIRSAVADHFPECDAGNYADTSRAIRRRIGGGLPAREGDVFGESGVDAYAGYAQTYLFHHLRTGGE